MEVYPKPGTPGIRSGLSFSGKKQKAEMTPEREAVLKAILEADRPIAGKEIAEALQKKPGTIRKMLFILKEAGEVKPAGYGLWIAGNASVTLPVTVATVPGVKKSGNASRKAVTVSGNALKPGKKAGQVELSEKEKARIAYNLMQNARHAIPEVRARRREQNRKWRLAHPDKARKASKRWRKENPDKVEASRIRQYAKRYKPEAVK